MSEEGGAEVAKIDPGAGRFRNHGLGVERDAEARGEQHRQVVRSVAHGERRRKREAGGRGQLLERGELGIAIEDRLLHRPAQNEMVVDQHVGAMVIEAEGFGDPAGEKGKTAGDERRRRAVRAHGRNEGVGARGEAEGSPGLLEGGDGKPLEHRDPPAQTLAEVDLAVHAGACDFRDLRPQPGMGGELVERFGGDDGAVHVRKQEPFAPARRRRRDRVDRRALERDAYRREVRRRGAGELDRLARREHRGRAAADGIAHARDNGSREEAGAAIGDQGEHVSHLESQIESAGARTLAGGSQRSKPVVGLREAVIVAGPTASGKSALAAALAERLRGTIINADAMQLYRELRVLTARPTKEEEARVPHRLYGVRPAAEPASAAWWRTAALAAMEEARDAGRLPILCGGSGLYLAALIEGFSEIPAPSPEARAEARALLAEIGPARMHARLAEVDPETARRLRPSDSQRLARAFEVWRSTGRGLATWQGRSQMEPPPFRFTAILLDPPRATLRAAIAQRFTAMLGAGALEEVRALRAQGLDPSLPALRAHGVPELSTHLAGEIDLDEAAARTVLVTGQYAKRQSTWFRHHDLADPARTHMIHARIAGDTQFLQTTFSEMITFIQSAG